METLFKLARERKALVTIKNEQTRWTITVWNGDVNSSKAKFDNEEWQDCLNRAITYLIK